MRVRVVERKLLGDTLIEEWADTRRRTYVEGERAFVPVKDEYPCERVIPDRSPYKGRGFQMIGDIAVLHGKKPVPDEIDRIIKWRHPRGVIWIKSFHGAERIPDAELLAGSVGETVHVEQGITFHLNPCKVMFAQGNREEKVRMQRLTTPGERVADMFAGIGYFTIPIAIKGAYVHAMEINPVAYRYLEQNIPANRVESRVTSSYGNCTDLLSGIYDRIVMGHFEAFRYLPVALEHIRPGSVIHVHTTGNLPPHIDPIICEAGYEAEISMRKVKKYGPGIWHWVQDVRCR
jgi:tRNA wybutosine-synthesizing protein 2